MLPQGLPLLLPLGFLLHLLNILGIIIEAARRHLVQTEDALVGILDKHKLGILIAGLQAHVGNRADNAPSVGEREVHLCRKVLGLPADTTEDDVLIVGLW